MGALPLRCGRTALIDDADIHMVGAYSWRSQPAGDRTGNRYAYAYHGGRKLYLHRVILGATDKRLVDHVNGDGLDNRRANLRLASRSENNANRSTSSATGYRGVSLAGEGRYRAWISERRNGRKIKHLGTFATAVEAAFAYDTEAALRFGAFARLNLPRKEDA